MDNTRDLPGYKYYVDPETGERPAVYVAYLDLEPDPKSTVNGLVFPLTHQNALDARERNYERRDITGHLTPPIGGRTWAYFGTPAAQERFNRGSTGQTAVISGEYLAAVRDGFAQLGPEHLKRFDASTDPPPVPIRGLRRIDTPPT
jgi:hypothetical protein